MVMGIGFIIFGTLLALGILFGLLLPAVQTPDGPPQGEIVKNKGLRIALSVVGVIFGVGFIVAGVMSLVKA
ncbi:MAG TPA: hypothetical protein VF599_13835 [Pyrinomonadaceae bacterium]|jgi:hypothetical protein